MATVYTIVWCGRLNYFSFFRQSAVAYSLWRLPLLQEAARLIGLLMASGGESDLLSCQVGRIGQPLAAWQIDM